MDNCCSDRISDLPESIRNHIISFLPMEDAIRTSILSKQWRNVCSSLPNLCFDQETFSSSKSKSINKELDFVDFVDSVLSCHDESDIQKFKLYVTPDDFCIHRLNPWISFAIQHNVKEICVYSFLGNLEHPPLAACLFTCKTLNMLTLYYVNFNVPEIIELSMLKVLKLCSDNFCVNEHNQIELLILGCPLLEDLSINLFLIGNHNNSLKISASNLKKLYLYVTCHYEVQIYCSNLYSIQYIGSPPDIRSEVLPFLSSASMHYSRSSFEIATSVYIRRASNIFNTMRNVVTLQLGGFCIEFLTRDRDLLSHLPNSCCSLRELILSIFPTENQVQVVILLLRSYPNLQDLSVTCSGIQEVDESIVGVHNNEGFHQSQEMSTEGALKHLRKVKISYFEGRNCEFDLVRYLLAYANILESMRIACTEEFCEDAESRMSVSEEFLNFTKASPYVLISFLLVFSKNINRWKLQWEQSCWHGISY